MEHIKQTFKGWIEDLRVQKHILAEAWNFYKLSRKYNASVNTDNDIEKMQYTLLRENHTIEKGWSMKNPRLGFGQQKVSNLLTRLNKYVTLHGKNPSNLGFLDYPLTTIRHYIEYTKSQGVDIPLIESQFNDVIKRLGNKKFEEKQTGVIVESKEHILENCNKDFKSLLYSRHSLRYFKNAPVDKSIINEALMLAQRTPSACNRQGWKTHVFQGDDSHMLLKWQGGCRGFEEEIHTCILVTANMKAFLSYEVHQAYVDGGLYAMNLINSLHSLGVATIPLSTAFYSSKLKQLKDFGIPENEVPIVIVGCGYMLDKFKVAVSERKDISVTNTFH